MALLEGPVDDEVTGHLLDALGVLGQAAPEAGELADASEYLEGFKDRDDALWYAGHILRADGASVNAQHYALRVVHRYVLRRAVDLRAADLENLQEAAIGLIERLPPRIADSSHPVRATTADVVGELILRSYPERWRTCMADLSEALNTGLEAYVEVVALALRSVAQICADRVFQSRIDASRRSELVRGLNEDLPELIPQLLKQLEDAYGALNAAGEGGDPGPSRVCAALTDLVQELAAWVPIRLLFGGDGDGPRDTLLEALPALAGAPTSIVALPALGALQTLAGRDLSGDAELRTALVGAVLMGAEAGLSLPGDAPAGPWGCGWSHLPARLPRNYHIGARRAAEMLSAAAARHGADLRTEAVAEAERVAREGGNVAEAVRHAPYVRLLATMVDVLGHPSQAVVQAVAGPLETLLTLETRSVVEAAVQRAGGGADASASAAAAMKGPMGRAFSTGLVDELADGVSEEDVFPHVAQMCGDALLSGAQHMVRDPAFAAMDLGPEESAFPVVGATDSVLERERVALTWAQAENGFSAPSEYNPFFSQTKSQLGDLMLCIARTAPDVAAEAFALQLWPVVQGIVAPLADGGGGWDLDSAEPALALPEDDAMRVAVLTAAEEAGLLGGVEDASAVTPVPRASRASFAVLQLDALASVWEALCSGVPADRWAPRTALAGLVEEIVREWCKWMERNDKPGMWDAGLDARIAAIGFRFLAAPTKCFRQGSPDVLGLVLETVFATLGCAPHPLSEAPALLSRRGALSPTLAEVWTRVSAPGGSYDNALLERRHAAASALARLARSIPDTLLPLLEDLAAGVSDVLSAGVLFGSAETQVQEAIVAVSNAAARPEERASLMDTLLLPFRDDLKPCAAREALSSAEGLAVFLGLADAERTAPLPSIAALAGDRDAPGARREGLVRLVSSLHGMARRAVAPSDREPSAFAPHWAGTLQLSLELAGSLLGLWNPRAREPLHRGPGAALYLPSVEEVRMAVPGEDVVLPAVGEDAEGEAAADEVVEERAIAAFVPRLRWHVAGLLSLAARRGAAGLFSDEMLGVVGATLEEALAGEEAVVGAAHVPLRDVHSWSRTFLLPLLRWTPDRYREWLWPRLGPLLEALVQRAAHSHGRAEPLPVPLPSRVDVDGAAGVVAAKEEVDASRSLVELLAGAAGVLASEELASAAAKHAARSAASAATGARDNLSEGPLAPWAEDVQGLRRFHMFHCEATAWPLWQVAVGVASGEWHRAGTAAVRRASHALQPLLGDLFALWSTAEAAAGGSSAETMWEPADWEALPDSMRQGPLTPIQFVDSLWGPMAEALVMGTAWTASLEQDLIPILSDAFVRGALCGSPAHAVLLGSTAAHGAADSPFDIQGPLAEPLWALLVEAWGQPADNVHHLCRGLVAAKSLKAQRRKFRDFLQHVATVVPAGADASSDAALRPTPDKLTAQGSAAPHAGDPSRAGSAAPPTISTSIASSFTNQNNDESGALGAIAALIDGLDDSDDF